MLSQVVGVAVVKEVLGAAGAAVSAVRRMGWAASVFCAAGLCVAGALQLLLPSSAQAQTFAAYVSPPRIVSQVAAGKTLRQTLDIQHVGRETGLYRVYTTDWSIGADQSLRFDDALAEGSCRPWVALERRQLSLGSGERFRFRLEISPPADTPSQECRFAVMVEGQEPTRTQGDLPVPVGGRIAVIVYARIGDAAPKLEISSVRVAKVNGQMLPLLFVSNSGNAHGRLEGIITATDDSGTTIELAPADGPIMPGQSKQVPLQPVVAQGREAPVLKFPLKLAGQLESGNKRLSVEAELKP